MLSDELRTRLVDVRSTLAEAGIEHVAVFGSRARGEARPDSDIDILVDIRPNRPFSLFDLVGVEQTVTQATGLRTNAFMRRSLDARFKARIEADIIQVF